MGSFNPWSLLTGGVSGLFGLGTTALNNQAEKINTDRTNATNLQIARESNQLQQSENILNREFNASEAEKAYQRELEKMQIQHQYNSPIELVRQMREAGLNPASASGGDFGTAMANSGQASYNTGLSPAMPNMIKPILQPFPNIIDGMLDGALKLAQVKKIGADTGLSQAQSNQINKTLEQSLRLLTVHADQAEFVHFLDTAFAPLERVQGFEAKKSEIAVNWQMALKLASEGKLIEAREANERVLTGLYEAQKKLTGASADEVRERIKWMAPLNNAKINELAASAQANRAKARNLDANSWEVEEKNKILGALKTRDTDNFVEIVLRNIKSDLLDNEAVQSDIALQSEIKDYLRQCAENDALLHDPTNWAYYVDRLLGIISGASSAGISAAAQVKAARIKLSNKP